MYRSLSLDHKFFNHRDHVFLILAQDMVKSMGFALDFCKRYSFFKAFKNWNIIDIEHYIHIIFTCPKRSILDKVLPIKTTMTTTTTTATPESEAAPSQETSEAVVRFFLLLLSTWDKRFLSLTCLTHSYLPVGKDLGADQGRRKNKTDNCSEIHWW